jgi:Uma2 family endonuclease
VVSDTDDLARVLFGLDAGTLTTGAVTARITRAVVEWAAARGWATRTEARVGVGEETRLGFVDVIVLRQPRAPDLAIEIDSTDKPWSVDKLRHVAAAGMHAVWIRWGDEEWAGGHEDVDVIQLAVTRRPASRVPDARQMTLWH